MKLEDYIKRIKECPELLDDNTSESNMYGSEIWFPVLIKGDFDKIVSDLKEMDFKVTSCGEAYGRSPYSYTFTDNNKMSEFNIIKGKVFDYRWPDFLNKEDFDINGMIYGSTCYAHDRSSHKPRHVLEELYAPFAKTIITISDYLKEKNYKFGFPDSTDEFGKRDFIFYNPIGGDLTFK